MMAVSHDLFKGNNKLSLITSRTLQSLLLVDVLNNYLGVPICLCDETQNITDVLNSDTLIIFDASLLDAEQAQRDFWLRTIFHHSLTSRIILINVHRQDLALRWYRHANIIAAFPAQMHLRILLHRLRALLVLPMQSSEAVGNRVLRARRPSLPLTLRELEVMKAMQQGASNQDISQMLYISENTVRTHIYNIFKKIAVKNRTQAVKWADANLDG
ncbi:LuxR C-terminal-related transcriptional regulator [Edwardsiella tarda]|uniref:Helix-turn-helix transcriptional regulator n=1 Tax=Edwardsiella tarda TaxID=636 RepID=A0A2A7U1Y9_EDWTA|nr:LuxR C-terminal-related transcriptional regulator [Edwardsiella tarda]PEH72288.1 helix-turn-helix transcriptional regulator [Edwardsiella tarda]UCQ28833.1 LuxR C-terminal-related transcriptional regulator [Edwardsiella tarda]